MNAAFIFGLTKNFENSRIFTIFNELNEGPSFSKTIEGIEERGRKSRDVLEASRARDSEYEKERSRRIEESRGLERKTEAREERVEADEGLKGPGRESQAAEAPEETAPDPYMDRADRQAEDAISSSQDPYQDDLEPDPASTESGFGQGPEPSPISSPDQAQENADGPVHGMAGLIDPVTGQPATWLSNGTANPGAGLSSNLLFPGVGLSQQHLAILQQQPNAPFQANALHDGKPFLFMENLLQAGGGAKALNPDLLKNLPNLGGNLLEQIKSQFTTSPGTTRIPLVPPQLGEIQVQIAMLGGQKTARISASQGLVQNALNNNFGNLQNLFSVNGVIVNQAVTQAEAHFSMGAQGESFDAALNGSTAQRTAGLFDNPQADAAHLRSESMLSERYGIRNLHEHLLEQIRVRLDPGKNEARIRLHPPELGEIKIHLVMEERSLTVRMEVNESLTRALLERDVQQLKAALAEAGIDVGRFEIDQGRERSSRQNNRSAADAPETGPADGSEENENESSLHAEPGAVRLSTREEGVDYLVY
ncbi:MAG: flagellar hook-length control protein FliK [Planctomycetota bacterium]|jgi:flagellar hook-length control protein FliK